MYQVDSFRIALQALDMIEENPETYENLGENQKQGLSEIFEKLGIMTHHFEDAAGRATLFSNLVSKVLTTKGVDSRLFKSSIIFKNLYPSISECSCNKAPDHFRSSIEQKVVDKLEERGLDKTEPLIVTSFHSGECFQELALVSRLIKNGYSNIILNLIEPWDKGKAASDELHSFFADNYGEDISITINYYSSIDAYKTEKFDKPHIATSIDNDDRDAYLLYSLTPTDGSDIFFKKSSGSVHLNRYLLHEENQGLFDSNTIFAITDRGYDGMKTVNSGEPWKSGINGVVESYGNLTRVGYEHQAVEKAQESVIRVILN